MAYDTGEVIYASLGVLIAVPCCLGNLLVIWAVWTCGVLKQQPIFCFIVSLAVADFLVGAVSVPLRVLADSRVQMPFYGCLSFCCWVLYLPLVSVFSQLSLACDRFLRVIIPLRYKTIVTTQRCWWVVAACWLVAAVVSFTPLMGWNNRGNTPPGNWSDCQFLDVMSMSYLVHFYFYTCFVVPMLIMTALYCGIFTLIRRQLRRPSIGVSHLDYRKERNLIRSLVLVLVLFAGSWLPIHIIDMVNYYVGVYTVPLGAVYAGILLFQASSAINPVIYALKIQQIRRACRSILRRVFCCKKENAESGDSHTPANNNDSSSNTRRARCDIEVKTDETSENW